MLTVAIVGSRTFNDYEKFKSHVTSILSKIGAIEYKIVSGGAIGADSMARKFALENGMEIVELKPDWNKYGRSAGFIRNTDIITSADHVIAFLQNNSNGTNDSIKKASRHYSCVI